MSSLLDFLAQVSVGIHSLPAAAHVLAGLGLVGGVFIWLMGRRLLRPGFAFLGGVLGGTVGFFLLPQMAPATVFGAPSPYVGLSAGMVLGVLSGVVFYHFAVAILMAGALGMAGLLISAAAVQFEPFAEGARASVQAPAGATGVPGQPQAPETVADRVNGFMTTSTGRVQRSWDALPKPNQSLIVAAVFGGALLGFAVGIAAPMRSAAGSTAMFGAAAWLASGLWLVNALSMAGREWLNRGGVIGWLIVWVVASALGFAFQLGTSSKKKSPTRD